MKNYIEKVRDFQKTFGQPIQDRPDGIPGLAVTDMRFDLLQEELWEYAEATDNKDQVEVADALVDIAYVLFGAVNEMGMHNIFEDMFNEVHRSNMSKAGADGKPIYREDGKILKGPNYSPPNLEKFLNKDANQLEMKL